MFGTLVFIIGLLVSIAVHEAGHLLVAKRVGAGVSHFSIGFGPTLFSKRWGSTLYVLKAIPFGGFVRIIGMTPSSSIKADTPKISFLENRDAAILANRSELETDFYKLSVSRKTLTMFAGPAANMLLAAALLVVIVSLVGTPAPSTTIGVVSECVSVTACSDAASPSPALLAGLTAGTEIEKVNGVPISNWQDLADSIAASTPGSVIRLTVVDDTQTQRVVAVVVAANPQSATVGFLGISPAVTTTRVSPVVVPRLLVRQSRAVLGALSGFPVRVYSVFSDSLAGRQRTLDDPIGLVGAGRIGADIGSTALPFSHRLGQLLALLAGLNVSLAVFNLIPLLPLDGGHIALAWFEGARSRFARFRRRPIPPAVDMRRLQPLTYAVVLVFVVLSVLLLWADLVNPVTFG